MQARFVDYNWENDSQTIATFRFRPDEPYRFVAGQYAVLSLPHTGADDRGTTRTMTISSAPDEELLSFTMKIYPKSSSFKRALLALHFDDPITIFESLGDLVLPLDTSIPLVFIAGGVGVASFTGMTSWLTTHQESRHIQLHYVVTRSEDIVLQNVFEVYADIGDLIASLYITSVKRLSAATILQTAQGDSLYYISGPEVMVETIVSELINAGVPRSSIVFDYFDGYIEL